MPFKDPGKAKDYQREYRRRTRAGDCTTPSQAPIPTEFRLKTAADVLELLAEQIAAVRSDGKLTTAERARTIGFLAGVSLRAIEAGNNAARIEALEAILKARK